MAPTVTQQREAVTEAGRRAADELAQARERRGRLSLDVMAGKAGARKELEALDARIGELAREVELASLAIQEADRRASETEAKAALDRRAEDEAELARLADERDARYRAVEDLLARLAPEVEAALAAGAGIYGIRTQLGHTIVPDWTSRSIHNRLCERLGAMGAGLRGLEVPAPALRSPLVDDSEGGTR